MRRTFAVLIILLACRPACAALDAYTGWLAGQPLTRLDGLVMNAQRYMDRLFLEDEDDTPIRRAFDASLAKSSTKVARTYATFDFASNSLRLGIVAKKGAVTTGEDCEVLLDAARERMIRTAFFTATGLSDEERRTTATDILSTLLVTPSRTEAKGAPADLAERVAAQAKVVAFVDKSDDPLASKSCSGSLGGTDVDLKIR